ncbi:peptidase M61 [Aquimarina gracilis]|uniref:Peptidase M61 n=1 Tax=Aquimarina gracilis TaxID=874422 RepID=A0ABU5ZYD8_9FLAO|nr:peptidase M61 [Aquimarina gracilis]MEB3346894.1 peptidase M61 [Aquimarina gracilis]
MASCKASESIVTPKVSAVTVSIDLVNVVDDKVKVEIQIDNISTDTISYYIPKIVPGTYQNNNYGRYIDDFKAFNKEGSTLGSQKHGDNRWKISSARQLHKISYWVNDTFDCEETHDIFSPTGTNILKDKNFVLNLYAFVGYFDKFKETQYRLFIKRPKSLEASTSTKKIIPENPVDNQNYDIDRFIFKRYADVADSPIMYSDPDQVTFTVNGIEVLLSVYSPGKIHTAARIMPQMERMIRAQRNFLGDINATKKYSVLLYLSSTKKEDAKGFGALEHNTSTVVVLPESISKKKLNESLTDVVSHEFFHIVTPLTIHSEEIHDFDYNNPKMSEHIWLYEGTTEYFSLLFQITQGLTTEEEFLERLLEKIEISKQFDDTMSFTTMSKNILAAPYRENYRNVYEKGALISMCIDIIMREKSNGVYGVLDLIKNLSNKFGADTPFKDKELIKTIKEISYPEVSDFLENHVVNNQPINYGFYLNKVGVIYSTTNVPSSYFIHEQQPLVKGLEGSKEIVFESNITLNSFLKNLGVQGGDILQDINNKTYTIKNIYDLFGDSNQWKLGDDISFRIKRGGQEVTLTSKVIEPTMEKIVLQLDPSASEQQVDLFKKWIND